MRRADDRHQINAYLSGNAYEGWRNFARTQGVTVTALLEAIGLELATIDETNPPPFLRRAARAAVTIDINRRARRPPDH